MWEVFCEALGRCGRRAGLFIPVLLFCAVAGPFWERGGAVAYAGLIAGSVVWSLRAILGAQPPRGRLGKFPPLSRHDLRAARSKLKRNQSQHER